MKKIIFIAPHLSTGGLPQYLFKKIELLKDSLEIYCIEYEDITGGHLVVQRNRIKSILDDKHFITIGSDKLELLKNIYDINPDYIHIEEIPEYFLPSNLADLIYTKYRKYKIFETSHDSSFDPTNRKIYLPDAFFFVSQWQIDQYVNIDVPKYLAEYPIEYKERPDRNKQLISLGLDPLKKHILNVGLFTERKNQGEIFELAKYFDSDVQFHFLGNQAGNFENYWKPLMNNKPENCIIWGERDDTDRFYQCMDLFLFTSRGNPGNKETMPLVLRESLGWNMKILMYNLDVYQDYFDKYSNVSYLSGNRIEDSEKIKKLIGNDNNLNIELAINESTKWISVDYNRDENKLFFSVEKTHPELKFFNYRIRDAVNGLTFQPIGYDIDFVKGVNWTVFPNANNVNNNGILLEFFDNSNNIIDSITIEYWGKVKGHYSPLVYPKTEVWIGDKKIKLHNHPNDTSSYWTFYECYIKQEYKNIEPGDIVVDIGANLGFFSLYALRQGASISYALEPFTSTYEYLVKNTEGVNIKPLNLGVGLKDEIKTFVGGEITSMSRLIDLENKEEDAQWGKEKEKEDVKLKPFDQIVKEQGIDFIDYLKIDCEGGEVELFETIDPDYLKYKIKKIAGEIHLFATGKSGYEKIKTQIISAGFDYEDNYEDGKELVVFYAQRKPKIKIIHILNTTDGEREKKSIGSLSKLADYGIEYSQDITPLWKTKPPIDNCNRPSQVSEIPGDYLLSPGHYGCYLGHKRAICNAYSDEDFDAILVSECDTILQIPAKEMSERIIKTYFSNIKNNLVLTSYGKKLEGFPHDLIEEDLFSTKKVVEAHLYLVDRTHLPILRNLFNTMPWDVSDLWYDTFLSDYKRGIYKKPYALQADGESYLDLRYKNGHEIHDHNVIFNPLTKDDDITVIIQTCDKYSNIWNGWYLSWNRYWNKKLNWPVYFCNEEKTLPFNDPNINQIKSPLSSDASGFSNRLIDILGKVKTKYVLYMQEDMWLTNEVDLLMFKEALYKMRYNDWNCLRIHEKIWVNYDLAKTSHFIGEKRILRSTSSSEWLLSHNAGIWNKDFLLSVMEPNEDPWNNEIEGTVRIFKKTTNPKIYHLNHRWYYQPSASQNGTINPFMKQYEEYLSLTKELNKKFDL